MTSLEALAAYEHAQEIASGCESIEELDAASDIKEAYVCCPRDFTFEQQDLAQKILLHLYVKSIGRR